MGTRLKKDATIKIRVSNEQKRLFKNVATKKNISMSELLIGCTENVIEKERLRSLEQERTRPRVEEFETKIQKIKARMEERKQSKNKSIWNKKIFKVMVVFYEHDNKRSSCAK